MASKKVQQKITPLGDRVVIKRNEESGDTTASGIIIPDTVAGEKPQVGTVIAVGEGKTTDEGNVLPLKVKVGDTVLFARFGIDEVELDGEEYIIVGENSLLAIIS